MSKENPPSRIAVVTEYSKAIVAAVFAGLILIAVGLTVFTGWRDSADPKVIIDEIKVVNAPGKAAKPGVTPEGATRLLLDHMIAFKNNVTTRRRLAEIGRQEPVVEIKVQDVSISGIVTEVRRLAGFASPRLSGDILCAKDDCSTGDVKLILRYRGRSGARSKSVDCERIEGAGLSTLVASCLEDKAAKAAWMLIDPFVVAVYAANWRKKSPKLNESETTAIQIVADRRGMHDVQTKAWAANLLCLTYRKYGEIEENRKPRVTTRWLHELLNSFAWCKIANELSPRFAIARTNAGDTLVDIGVALRKSGVAGRPAEGPEANREAAACFKEAILEYERARLFDKKYPRPLRRMGRALHQLGRVSSADQKANWVGIARSRNIGFRSIWRGKQECEKLAEHLLDPDAESQKRCPGEPMAEAVDHLFKQGIRENSRYAEGHRSYGDRLQDGGRCDAAVREFQRAVSLDPYEERYRAGLVGALRLNGQMNFASSECSELRRLLKSRVMAPPLADDADCFAEVAAKWPAIKSNIYPEGDRRTPPASHSGGAGGDSNTSSPGQRGAF